MMKKSVSINEDMNEIRYYEKDIVVVNTEDYLSTVLKYLCTKTDCDEICGEKEEERQAEGLAQNDQAGG